MAIKDRAQIKEGAKLVGRYQQVENTCEVVVVDGRVMFQINGNPKRVFKSLSAAGKAITEHECDGWHFWSIAGGEPGAAAKETAASEKPTKSKAKAGDADPITREVPKHGIHKMEDQRGAPAGLLRYYCFDCNEPFSAQSSVLRPACPNTKCPTNTK